MPVWESAKVSESWISKCELELTKTSEKGRRKGFYMAGTHVGQRSERFLEKKAETDHEGPHASVKGGSNKQGHGAVRHTKASLAALWRTGWSK